MINNKLIVFTSSFPYGLKETFFENELPYLAENFDSILIIPLINPYPTDDVRILPANVTFLTPTVPNSKMKRILYGILNSSPIKLFIYDFFRGKVYKSINRLTHWFNSFLLFRLTYLRFTNLIKKGVINDRSILYSYWGEAPLFTTKLAAQLFKIIRMHRVDFYEEVNDGYLPNRKKIYNSSDLLIPISTNISEILINFYSVDKEKVFISRLGVDNNYNIDLIPKEDRKIIRLVSCSRVDPVKRVDKILKAIKNYSGDYVIEWHHFGDGLIFNSLKNEVKMLTENTSNDIQIYLHGWTKQSDLFSFYKNNHVDWFVNVSESEGIPVSIMEAMSFGIPVIATDVGATSEIVNSTNGFLLDVKFDSRDLLTRIISDKENGNLSKRRCAYSTWKTNYQAAENYKKLVETMKNSINK